MSTKIGSQQKTESRGQYRRREDHYLCIEIQPEDLIATEIDAARGAI